MPIFDQGYQHWQGRLAGHAWRWLAVTRQGVRQQTRRRLTKWLVAVAFLPSLVLAAVLVCWGLLEQQSSLLQPFAFLIQALPEDLRSGPKAYRGMVWTLAFNFFLEMETSFAMLLVLTVGPDLISQDLRFNAIPLYLSRPIRRVDYFLGKLGVIGVFIAAVSVAPAVVAYALGVAFSMDLGVFRETWRLLAGSVAYGLVVVLSAGTLMLAVSSLSRNSRLVGATWIGLWVISNVSGTVLEGALNRDWCGLVSYTSNLARAREELLDTAPARNKFLSLAEAAIAARDQARRQAFPFGRGRNRRRPPPPPVPIETPAYLRAPWTWSAGVLTGLFVLSGATLATRIKSLDRLK
jgi:ABC-2 type transport system permease protein